MSTSIRALLVDDDPDLARLLRDYLGTHDVAVTHVIDGPSGLAALEKEPDVKPTKFG